MGVVSTAKSNHASHSLPIARFSLTYNCAAAIVGAVKDAQRLWFLVDGDFFLIAMVISALIVVENEKNNECSTKFAVLYRNKNESRASRRRNHEHLIAAFPV